MSSISVWAPKAHEVCLVLLPEGERVPMVPGDRGMFTLEHPRLQPGQCYGFSLDGGPMRPDPRSRHQPEGVHGPSCRVDLTRFSWDDAGFQAPPLGAGVLYELHVGTFSPEGTFDGAIARLPWLKELGVTHIEIMPVAHFPGQRGWGYDGVCWFAPHPAYGGTEGLCRLVNASHRAGIAVLLDVVYNHFGPSGNYLSEFGPYFTSTYRTPWGDALNFDGPGSDEVRRFVCDNACEWLEHYHLDGLRLDAVHAIYDHSATHILAQLAECVDDLSVRLGRHLVLIAESDLNDAKVVRTRAEGGYALTSTWSDDLHHAVHALLTGERSGYYRDYGKLEHLAQGLRHGFVYRGQYSPHRGRCFGGDSLGLRGRQFVVCTQNHDQVGNRAVGDRPSMSASVAQQKLAAAIVLLSPFVPMLFMGEEWGCLQPFQYFTDHEEPWLAEAIRSGRRQEFSAFGWDPRVIPDPQAEASFEASKLVWSDASSEPHREVLAWYRSLIALRRHEPSLAHDRLEETAVDYSEEAGWLTFRRGAILTVCNFRDETRTVELDLRGARTRLASDPEISVASRHIALPPHAVAVLEV